MIIVMHIRGPFICVMIYLGTSLRTTDIERAQSAKKHKTYES